MSEMHLLQKRLPFFRSKIGLKEVKEQILLLILKAI